MIQQATILHGLSTLEDIKSMVNSLGGFDLWVRP